MDVSSAPAPVSHQRAFGLGELSVKQTGGTTSIARLYQRGCAKIRVPRSHTGKLEAIMINSSGGLTGGDRLHWNFTLAEATNATITTQACERVYRSTGDEARTDVSIDVAANATLNWLPQEAILFDGGNFSRTTTINLADTASLLMIESVIFGRRAMGEKVHEGRYRDSWRIHQNGTLLHAEEFLIKGNIAQQLTNPFAADNHEAISTILLVSPGIEGMLDTMRTLLGIDGAVSCWNGKLLARLTAQDGYTLRKKLVPLINMLNHGAAMPKIWSL